MNVLRVFVGGMGLFAALVTGQNISDFRVNNEDYPSQAIQDYPCLSCDSIGNAIVVWSDGRAGWMSIYAQRMRDDGIPVDTNFKANDSATTWNQWASVATRRDGSFAIDYCAQQSVFVRRFDQNGNPLGSSIKVNEDSLGPSAYRVDAACDREGRSVVLWSAGYYLYGQRLDSAGNRLGSNFRVSDSTSSSDFYPGVNYDDSGNSIVAWVITPSGFVYAQRYDRDGNRLGQNFRVNDDNLPAANLAGVACLASGRSVVVWRSSSTKVCARLLDASGNPIGSSFVVNRDSTTAYICSPSVARSGEKFVIAWAHTKNLWQHIVYFQLLDSLGNRIGSNVVVNQDTTFRLRAGPDVGSSDRGDFYLTWHREDPLRSRQFDILYQAYSAQGSPIGLNRIVSTDVGGGFQVLPSIACDPSGNFFVNWSDTRRGCYIDIFARRFDQYGNAFLHDFRVVDDTSYVHPHEMSCIALNNAGLYVIAWADGRDTARQVYCQRYDRNAVALGPNYRVSELPSVGYGVDVPRIAALPNGQFIVCWSDDRAGDFNIFGRRLDGLGLPVGSDFMVNDDTSRREQKYPSIAADNVGNFAIAWHDARDSTQSLYGQRYDINGARIGPNFRISRPGIVTDADQFPGISFDARRECIIIWTDSGVNIRAQRFDSAGSPVGPNFLVSTDRSAKKKFPCATGRNAGEFFVLWSDLRTFSPEYYSLYGQLYRNWQRIGPNSRFDRSTGVTSQEFPSMTSDSGRVYVVWSKWRESMTDIWDVYARVVGWGSLPGVEEEHGEVQACVQRLGIWPNPSKGVIRLQVLSANGRNTKIRIYDVAGRMVSDLSKSLGAGRVLSVSLNPGVYFIEYSNEAQTITKKAVVVE